MMRTNILIDLSNVVHTIHHSLMKKHRNDFSKELLFYNVIDFVKNISNRYKADGILVACDSPKVWRRDIYPEYKLNREGLRDIYYEDIKDIMIKSADFFNSCTSIPALSVPKAEADDIIALGIQYSLTKNIIISSDKDFIQLLDKRTRLYAPSLKKERFSENVAYDLFEKCIRGDSGDNIPSAYPRVRKTVLEKAFIDNYHMMNLMEVVKDKKKVGDVYKFNRKLIDLTQQPPEIKTNILNSLNNIKGNKFNEIKVLQFLRKNDFISMPEKILKNSNTFNKKYHL